MANIDAEEQQYQQEVEEVKKWWSDSRWRYTRRPFTAEQIVQKRGTLRLQYPSNAQAKKLWDIVEGRFKVSHFLPSVLILANRTRTTM
jgi:isocitrate lyase